MCDSLVDCARHSSAQPTRLERYPNDFAKLRLAFEEVAWMASRARYEASDAEYVLTARCASDRRTSPSQHEFIARFHGTVPASKYCAPYRDRFRPAVFRGEQHSSGCERCCAVGDRNAVTPPVLFRPCDDSAAVETFTSRHQCHGCVAIAATTHSMEFPDMNTTYRRLVLTSLTALVGFAAACGESVTAPLAPTPTIEKPRTTGYTVTADRPIRSTKGP